jgi:cytochrome c peroxidase
VVVERVAGTALLFVALSGCGESGSAPPPPEPEDPAKKALAALHYDDAPPPVDPSNRVADDAAARRFGQRLFFDASFSGALLEGDHDGSGGTLGMQGQSGRVSCASCHVPESNFVDTRSPHRQISLGAEWTARRSPSLLEVSFAPLFNWDGRHDTLWAQAIGVMESSKEFNSGRAFVAEQVFRLHRAEYETVFGPMPALDDAARFPPLSPAEAGCVEVRSMSGTSHRCRGKPGDGAEYDGMAPGAQREVTEVTVNAAKAMAAYVRQLRCGPGRFDAWLDGDDAALGESERRGAELFAGKADCVRCHSGSNFTDGQFHNVGLTPAIVAVTFVDANDRGAADGLVAAKADALNSHGAFSDGPRNALPDIIDPAMVGAFRTPSLRCASEHPSFMHTGQIRSLAQAVAFHDRGGDKIGGYPGQSELTPLGLTEEERADLVAFLQALEGEGPPEALLHAPN